MEGRKDTHAEHVSEIHGTISSRCLLGVQVLDPIDRHYIPRTPVNFTTWHLAPS